MNSPLSLIKKLSLLQKIVLGVFVLVIVVIAFFIVTGDRSSSKNTRQEEALVTVAGKSILQADLDTRVSRKYDPSYITPELKTRELDVMVEEYLLDTEADQRNLSITTSPSVRAYYGELRRALFPDAVESVEAYIISYDASSANSTVKAALAGQHERIFSNSLGELELGGDPLIIAQKIVADYPQFANYLKVNGVNYNEAVRAENMPPAQTVNIQTVLSGASAAEVLNLRENEVKSWLSSAIPSAVIARVLNVSTTSTYKDWLNQKKAGSVSYLNDK